MSKHHHKGGGRVVKSPHTSGDFHGGAIETPRLTHGMNDHGPHHGSHPNHYAQHQDHVRKTHHGK